jgi:hypothetical protein
MSISSTADISYATRIIPAFTFPSASSNDDSRPA